MSNEDNEQQLIPVDIPTGNPGTDNTGVPVPNYILSTPVEMNNGKNE